MVLGLVAGPLADAARVESQVLPELHRRRTFVADAPLVQGGDRDSEERRDVLMLHSWSHVASTNRLVPALPEAAGPSPTAGVCPTSTVPAARRDRVASRWFWFISRRGHTKWTLVSDPNGPFVENAVLIHRSAPEGPFVAHTDDRHPSATKENQRIRISGRRSPGAVHA